MFICLGPSGSGKTALLSRLQDAHSITYPCPNPVTIPTMGTSWVTVNCQVSGKGKGKLNRNRKMTIRELGGAMAPIWPSYFSECPNGLLFVIDSSNWLQIAAATMLLLRSLSQQQTPRQCLIILNKLDICSDMSLHDLLFLLRLDDIRKRSQCQINVTCTSTITGQGIDEILQWLLQNCQDL